MTIKDLVSVEVSQVNFLSRTLNNLTNIFLMPSNYLLGGKTIHVLTSLNSDKELIYSYYPEYNSDEHKLLKTAVSIITFIPGVFAGLITKGIALVFSSELRKLYHVCLDTGIESDITRSTNFGYTRLTPKLTFEVIKNLHNRNLSKVKSILKNSKDKIAKEVYELRGTADTELSHIEVKCQMPILTMAYYPYPIGDSRKQMDNPGKGSVLGVNFNTQTVFNPGTRGCFAEQASSELLDELEKCIDIEIQIRKQKSLWNKIF